MSSIAEEYQFEPDDFKAMKFNVMEVPKGESLILRFPSLLSFSSFSGIRKAGIQLDNDKIIRYIMLCYDEESPARKLIPDEFKRKSWCGVMADFPNDPITGAFDRVYYDAMNCRIQTVNKMILDFSLLSGPGYALLVTGYEAYYNKLKLISDPPVKGVDEDPLKQEETRGKLYKQAADMEKDLRTRAIEMVGEKNVFLRDTLYRSVYAEVIERHNISPEERAFDKKPDVKQVPQQIQKG